MRKEKSLRIFENIENLHLAFEKHNYIADRSICLTSKIAYELEKPILLEGEAGVGKTEVAKVLAAALDTSLIRLQCYEGLDSASALYEWNYPAQLLEIRLAELDKKSKLSVEKNLFSERFLFERPLLRAIKESIEKPVVLLIDEIDRADEEFEAFLLEMLSDFQITIPEAGTFVAKIKPLVILTSNRTRELSDALKRRCLYLWIDYPDIDKEISIILKKVPNLSEKLAKHIAQTMDLIRRKDLQKTPGIAETIDWASSLTNLNLNSLSKDAFMDTSGTFIKNKDDLDLLKNSDIEELLKQARAKNNEK